MQTEYQGHVKIRFYYVNSSTLERIPSVTRASESRTGVVPTDIVHARVLRDNQRASN